MQYSVLPLLTKHLCILMPAPLWYLICINFLHWCRIFFGDIWDKFAMYLVQDQAERHCFFYHDLGHSFPLRMNKQSHGQKTMPFCSILVQIQNNIDNYSIRFNSQTRHFLVQIQNNIDNYSIRFNSQTRHFLVQIRFRFNAYFIWTVPWLFSFTKNVKMLKLKQILS